MLWLLPESTALSARMTLAILSSTFMRDSLQGSNLDSVSKIQIPSPAYIQINSDRSARFIFYWLIAHMKRLYSLSLSYKHKKLLFVLRLFRLFFGMFECYNVLNVSFGEDMTRHFPRRKQWSSQKLNYTSIFVLESHFNNRIASVDPTCLYVVILHFFNQRFCQLTDSISKVNNAVNNCSAYTCTPSYTHTCVCKVYTSY